MVEAESHGDHSFTAKQVAFCKLSHTNIFIPKLRPGFGEIAHELDARRVLENFHFHALRNI
jgi:hypothetical protein